MTVVNRADRQTSPAPAPRERGPDGGHWLGATALTVVGLVHALVVAPRYHVGSFDDDANYVLAARALAHGAGFTTRLTGGGAPLVGVYPPGLPVLLAPVARLWPHGLTPLRVLPFLCFAAIFPLTWRYLGARGIPDRARLAVLGLLALNPVLATYATMVMPETTFVVVLLLLLLAAERWRAEARAVTWAGAGTVAAAAAVLWLKEAGAGLVIGVVAWLLLRRLWRKALLVAVGVPLLFLPVLVARAIAGGALIGSRYSSDLGSNNGGIVGRVTHMAPSALWAYANDVFSLSIVGRVHGSLDIVQWTTALLVMVGVVVWIRTFGLDIAVVAVAFYLTETLFYPFTNERRIVLVLPVVVAWYVLGAGALFRLTAGAMRSWRSRMALPFTAATLVLLVALVPQFPRDYLLAVGQDTSMPAGSPYMAILRHLGQPGDVVETDYLWTTGLFTGHATANGAYQAPCDAAAIAAAIAADHAGFLLSAALNQPEFLPSPCVEPIAATDPGAVRLYRSPQANATVFELIGPGTGHPGLRDLTAGVVPLAATPVTMVPETPQIDGDNPGAYPTAEPAGPGAPAGVSDPNPSKTNGFAPPATAGSITFTWSWGHTAPITQISLAAARTTGATASVNVEWQDPTGQWHRAAAAPGAVGAEEATRYLLVSFSQPPMATAVRVTVAGQGPAEVHELHVL